MYDISTGSKAYDLMWLLLQTSDVVDRVLSRHCHLIETSVSAAQILYLLEGMGSPQTAYKLARLSGKQHHSIVELTNRMKARGLITRTEFTTDEGKKSGLVLTDAGRDMLKAFVDSKAIDDIVQHMSTGDLGKLMNGLTHLRDGGMKQAGEIHRGEVTLWK